MKLPCRPIPESLTTESVTSSVVETADRDDVIRPLERDGWAAVVDVTCGRYGVWHGVRSNTATQTDSGVEKHGYVPNKNPVGCTG